MRAGQLIVATDLGVFVSADTSGGRLRAARRRGSRRAGALARAQAQGDDRADTLIVATQGRGVYRLVLPAGPLPIANVAKAAGGPLLDPAAGFAAFGRRHAGAHDPRSRRVERRHEPHGVHGEPALKSATATGSGRG